MIPELTLLMCREKQNPGTHESRILELELSLHLIAARATLGTSLGFSEDHDEERTPLP